ncbi:MAG TPA: hypothetical protein EYG03_18890 [Planctomycetes bacterium]|nr:hypothetical protein [Fuerstiella sp.]HIK94018.1 hypothetical protein [Planctomycetota bacterium]
MKNDQINLQMQLLRLISMTSIGVGLWFLISQIVHNIESVNVSLFLPFLFAGWVGVHSHKVMSALTRRMTDLEKKSRVSGHEQSKEQGD